jgi:predicted DNA-binding transcriptional regulator AlpA
MAAVHDKGRLPATVEELRAYRKLTPSSHHLDKRAGELAAGDGDDDELLSSRQLADWLGVSVQWVEIGRTRGYGPPFLRLGPRMVRYRRGPVRKWLRKRGNA